MAEFSLWLWLWLPTQVEIFIFFFIFQWYSWLLRKAISSTTHVYRTMIVQVHNLIYPIVCWPMWTCLRAKLNSLRLSTSTFQRYLPPSCHLPAFNSVSSDIRHQILDEELQKLEGGSSGNSSLSSKGIWPQFTGGCRYFGGQEDWTAASGKISVFLRQNKFYLKK